MKKKPEKTPSKPEESLDEASEDEEMESDVNEASEDDSADEEMESDLAASSTDTDADSDEEEESSKVAATKTKSKAELIDEHIHNKYEQLKGTRLYVRYPQKLPQDQEEFEAKVKSLHPLIAKPIKPRQKHARFCLVDFNTQEDRDQALSDIKASIEKDSAFKGIFVSLPKTESQEFVNELVARKTQALENKKTKSLMKRASKRVKVKDNFTSTVVISNLPKTSSVAQVRQLFEDVVDIQIKSGKGKFRDFNAASVTLPTTHDARKVIKKDLSLNGTKLLLRFNNTLPKKPRNRPKKFKAEKGKAPPKKVKTKPVVEAH